MSNISFASLPMLISREMRVTVGREKAMLAYVRVVKRYLGVIVVGTIKVPFEDFRYHGIYSRTQ